MAVITQTFLSLMTTFQSASKLVFVFRKLFVFDAQLPVVNE